MPRVSEPSPKTDFITLVAHDVRKKRKRKRMTYTVQLEPQPQGRAGFKLLAKLSAPLFHAAQPRHLNAGERLFAVGDAGDGCYLLDQGLLKVTVTSPRGEERIIAILGPGAIVGELSMIDGMPRSASVAALRDSTLRFVSRQS